MICCCNFGRARAAGSDRIHVVAALIRSEASIGYSAASHPTTRATEGAITRSREAGSAYCAPFLASGFERPFKLGAKCLG